MAVITLKFVCQSASANTPVLAESQRVAGRGVESQRRSWLHAFVFLNVQALDTVIHASLSTTKFVTPTRS